MRARDAIYSAIDNLASHKLRSSLTMLGMTFGVAAVIAMLAIGAGAEKSALQLIDRLGLHNVVVRDRDIQPSEAEEVRKKSTGLSMRDVRAIQEAVPNAETVVPKTSIEPYQVLAGARQATAKVYGVSHMQGQVAQISLGEGRFFTQHDEDANAQICVIGAGVQQQLFGGDSALGKAVKIDDVWVTVVGVLGTDSVGGASLQGVSVGSTSEEIYVPITTALNKFERDPMKSPLSEVIVALGDGAVPQQSAVLIQSLLDRLHGGAADYDLVVPEALLRQNQETQRIFNIVMGCIAGIALLVGGIGIMNIMLASVLEQTREIGLRRAVGALRRDIRFQFLVESFCISSLGGIAGIVLGVGIAKVVAHYAGWPTAVTPISIIVATGVSSSVGLFSGIYPAVRASKLDPIEALQQQ